MAILMADHVYKTTSINPFTRSVDGVLVKTNTKTIQHKTKVRAVSSWNNNFMQKFENTKITIFLNSKIQLHVIKA